MSHFSNVSLFICLSFQMSQLLNVAHFNCLTFAMSHFPNVSTITIQFLNNKVHFQLSNNFEPMNSRPVFIAVQISNYVLQKLLLRNRKIDEKLIVQKRRVEQNVKRRTALLVRSLFKTKVSKYQLLCFHCFCGLALPPVGDIGNDSGSLRN